MAGAAGENEGERIGREWWEQQMAAGKAKREL